MTGLRPLRGLHCLSHRERQVELDVDTGLWSHVDGSRCHEPRTVPVYIPTCSACDAHLQGQFVFAVSVMGVQSLTCRSCGDVRVLDAPVWAP